LKKFLLILFVTLAVYSGCKKDISNDVTLTAADMAVVSGQLKGSWVFPVKTLNVVDSTGKNIVPPRNEPASAFEFDGVSKVTIRSDPQTEIKSTYTLSTSNGNIHIAVLNPDNTVTDFKVVMLNAQTLTLTSTEPYIYYNGSHLVPTVAVTSTVLQKLNSADVSGNFIRVNVNNDSIFNVKVHVLHAGMAAADTGILVGSKTGATGLYSVGFIGQSGDRLKVDVTGSIIKTSINAYFKGLPITGNISAQNNETITTTGWIVQFATTP
jgi:hypothetical protein